MTREPNLWARRPHDRHPDLYEAEYAKQLERIARIRTTVSAGLPHDEPPTHASGDERWLAPAGPRDDAPWAAMGGPCDDEAPPRAAAADASARVRRDGTSTRWDVAPADLAPPLGEPPRPWRRPPEWRRHNGTPGGTASSWEAPAAAQPDSRRPATTPQDAPARPAPGSRRSGAGTTRSRRLAVARWAALVAIAVGLAASALWLVRSEPRTAAAATTFRVPAQPTGIAVAGGRVWVAGPGAGAVWILDPATGRPAAPALRTGGTPARVAVGPRWAWVADTRSGAIVRARADGTGAPRVLSRGPDVTDVAVAAGAVWAAGSADGTIRVRPDRGPWRTLHVGSRPLALAADERRVVAVDASTGTLVRLSAARRRVEGPPIALGGAPVDVALDGEHAWAVDSAAGTLQRIDVDRGVADLPAPLCAAPLAVAAGRGEVFVLCRGDRALLHLDGLTGQLRRRTPLPAPPTALALDDRHVWIAAGEHEVIRVDR
ncbi:Vgb family protein [Solirubrobacter deserti]|uniref:PQQ-binding-like beta-propeller repeat protein n=1 Tax=Solirubrobacter deserti TaxID=2282478 RepID=A0ABT4RFW9_9ACTN|nr:hypothetical protein [Solirubrobacter deserti]MDA0137200.1 hypothetical protein [Solirubrobacter deserti]